MKAYVDKDLCIGCQYCVSACPAIFSMDDDGKSEPIPDEVPPDQEECVRDAESKCPVQAITVK